MLQNYFFKTVCMSLHILYACEIVDTENKGDKAMLESLKKSVDAQIPNPENIVIASGVNGCKAFGPLSLLQKKHVLLVWQWLDDLNNVHPNTIIVVPQHAYHEKFKKFKNVIQIDGVLHTTTLEKIKDAPCLWDLDPSLPEDIHLIVMLAGDVQQNDGTWKLYTLDPLKKFLSELPEDQAILFLNGPRTGKYIIQENKVTEDKKAHREDLDRITKRVFEQLRKNWRIVDFNYDKPSAWLSALKLSYEKNIPIIMESSSTSMISEMISCGLKPIIYKNPSMTMTSQVYMDHLVRENRAFSFENVKKELGKISIEQLPPPFPQEEVVVAALSRIINEKQ